MVTESAFKGFDPIKDYGELYQLMELLGLKDVKVTDFVDICRQVVEVSDRTFEDNLKNSYGVNDDMIRRVDRYRSSLEPRGPVVMEL